MNVVLRGGPMDGVRAIPEPTGWPTVTVERPVFPPPGGNNIAIEQGTYRAHLRRRAGSAGPPRGWLTSPEGYVILSWQGWR